MKHPLIGLGLAAGLLLSACSTPATPAAPAPTTPAATATSTAPAASPSAGTGHSAAPRTVAPKAKRSAASTSVIPGDLGTELARQRLPREGEPADDEVSAFAPADYPLASLDCAIEAPALAGLEASRIRERSVPEGTETDGLLIFASAEEAGKFVQELSTAYQACPTPGPESDNRGTPEAPIIERSNLATSPTTGLGEQALTARTWTERKSDGTWALAPGGSLVLWARSGRTVAFTQSGGEYVGDPVDEAAPGSVPFDLVTAMLAQN